MMNHPIAGVTVPLTTVMREPGRPSFPDSEQQLEALAASGIDNLMLFGSNGEGALISPEHWGDYPARVTKRWRELRPSGRVVINVSAPGTDELMARAQLASAAQPDALVASPPSYFRHSADEIEGHLLAAAGTGLPVVVYNLPRSANALPNEVFKNLLSSAAVIGVKDSSSDPAALEAFIESARHHPHAAVAQGDEQNALRALDSGAAGLVPGIANIAPRLAAELFGAHARGDRETAERTQARITELTSIHSIHPGVPSIKAVLRRRGIAPDSLARPLRPISRDESREIDDFIEQHDDVLIGSSAGRG